MRKHGTRTHTLKDGTLSVRSARKQQRAARYKNKTKNKNEINKKRKQKRYKKNKNKKTKTKKTKTNKALTRASITHADDERASSTVGAKATAARYKAK